MWWRQKTANPMVWVVQTDGAIAPDGSAAGIGVVIRDEAGRWVQWMARREQAMTNNEAEYAALCWALETAAAVRVNACHIYSDSEIMVNQMRGHYRVQSTALRLWHQRACALARHLSQVTYTHIPRERNQLADALAAEALLAPLPRPNQF